MKKFVLTLKCKVPVRGVWKHHTSKLLVLNMPDSDQAKLFAIAHRAPTGATDVRVEDCTRVETEGALYTEQHRSLLREAHDDEMRTQLEHVNLNSREKIPEQRCSECGLLLSVHDSFDEGSWYSSHLGSCPVRDVGAPFYVKTVTRQTMRGGHTGFNTLAEAKNDAWKLWHCNYPGLYAAVTDRRGCTVFARHGTATPTPGNANEFPITHLPEIG